MGVPGRSGSCRRVREIVELGPEPGSGSGLASSDERTARAGRWIQAESANRAGERHDVDDPGTACPQRRGGGRDGRARRVDVVDEDHRAWDGPGGREGTGDVPAALDERQPCLAADGPRPTQERGDLELPAAPELPGEPFGRLVPAAERSGPGRAGYT